jgi:hypothetical protein
MSKKEILAGFFFFGFFGALLFLLSIVQQQRNVVVLLVLVFYIRIIDDVLEFWQKKRSQCGHLVGMDETGAKRHDVGFFWRILDRNFLFGIETLVVGWRCVERQHRFLISYFVVKKKKEK